MDLGNKVSLLTVIIQYKGFKIFCSPVGSNSYKGQGGERYNMFYKQKHFTFFPL